MSIVKLPVLSISSFSRRAFSNKRSLKGKTASSARWCQRQDRDPYVLQARREGLRSRAAFKLREINEKYQIIQKGHTVIDLGAAPGGWAQVAAQISGISEQRQNVIAVDLLPFPSLAGVHSICGDLRKASTREDIQSWLVREHQELGVDVVLSDMAPSFSGQTSQDREAHVRLCQNAFRFSQLHLRTGGHFVVKLFECQSAQDFRQELKPMFKSIQSFKPSSSRSQSSEFYMIAKNFHGREGFT